MNKTKKSLLLAIFAVSAAHAKAEDGPKLRLGHNVLSQTWTTKDVADVKSTDRAFGTFKGGWELYATWDNLNVYLFPGQEGSSALVGYSVQSDLELGLGFAYTSANSNKATAADKPKVSSYKSSFNPYITKYVSVTDKTTLELTLSPTFFKERTNTTTDAGVSTTAKDNGTTWTATVLADQQIAGLLHYYASVAYATTEAKDDRKETVTTFVPVGLRYQIR